MEQYLRNTQRRPLSSVGTERNSKVNHLKRLGISLAVSAALLGASDLATAQGRRGRGEERRQENQAAREQRRQEQSNNSQERQQRWEQRRQEQINRSQEQQQRWEQRRQEQINRSQQQQPRSNNPEQR